MLGRDSPQQKPDLGRSRTKNNLPAAQEERRAKRTQITHMSGGESSASIFRDNRGEHGFGAIQCRTAALNSPQAFLGQQSSRRSIPPGSCPPSGEELPCLVPGSCREPQCSCAKERRPLLSPSCPPPRGSSSSQSSWEPRGLANSSWVGGCSPTSHHPSSSHPGMFSQPEQG